MDYSKWEKLEVSSSEDEKEIDPREPQKYWMLWYELDVAFNLIFLVALLWNMYGYGGPVRQFWKSGWNCFDFFIVCVGMIMMTGLVGGRV